MSEKKRPDFQQSIETRLVYGLLEALDVDETLARETVEDKLGKPYEECYGAVSSARRAMARDYGRHFESVRKVGLRRVQGADVIDASERDMKRSHRAARKAAKTLQCIDCDISELSPDERARLNMNASVAGAVYAITSSKKRKQLEGKFAEIDQELPLQRTLELFQNGKT
jgi:hypothetical protein